MKKPTKLHVQDEGVGLASLVMRVGICLTGDAHSPTKVNTDPMLPKSQASCSQYSPCPEMVKDL